MKVSREIKLHEKIPVKEVLLKKPVKEIITSINSESVFTATRESVPSILLKGVGKFCVCGCGKPIKGKWVKSKSKAGNWFMRFVKPHKNQIYASKACGMRVYDKTHRKDHNSKYSIMCMLKLKVTSMSKPYRELVLYMSKQNKIKIKITPESK